MNEIIEKLNDKFRYRTDEDKNGVEDYWIGWKSFTDDLDFWEGDCDDYSFYLYFNIEGCSVYFCEYGTYNQGHMICQLPDGSYIDNIAKKPMNPLDSTLYKNLYKYTKEDIQSRFDKDVAKKVTPKSNKIYGIIDFFNHVWNFIKNLFK